MRIMKSAAAVVRLSTVLLLVVLQEGSAFTVNSAARSIRCVGGATRSTTTTTTPTSTTTSLALAGPGDENKNLNSDFPPEETAEYTGSVDWDAEWKKVVKNGGVASNSGDRPGKDFYKSEAEIAAIVSVRFFM
jgi:hypothetical protein